MVDETVERDDVIKPVAIFIALEQVSLCCYNDYLAFP